MEDAVQGVVGQMVVYGGSGMGRRERPLLVGEVEEKWEAVEATPE